MAKTIIQAPATKAAQQNQQSTTFFVGVSHPRIIEINALLDGIARGESNDIAGDIAKAKAIAESPAFWLGVGRMVRAGESRALYLGADGKPTLNPASCWVYTADPTREVAEGEQKGLLVRGTGMYNRDGSQQSVVAEKNPVWENAVAFYREEIGAVAPAQAGPGTQIPAGKAAEATPAGSEEVPFRRVK